MKTIEIDVETYIDMLEDRRNFVTEKFNWRNMPDCLWDYFMDLIRDYGVNPNLSSPSYVVDNAIVNGDWGDFDEYKEEGETDEDFIEKVSDEVMFIDENERIVCYSI